MIYMDRDVNGLRGNLFAAYGKALSCPISRCGGLHLIVTLRCPVLVCVVGWEVCWLTHANWYGFYDTDSYCSQSAH